MGGVIDTMAKISEGFATHLPKNSAPPQQEGEEEEILQSTI